MDLHLPPEMRTAAKMNVANQYAADAARNASEANQTGMNIISNLQRQNEQMKGISNKTANINTNVQTSNKYLEEMKRKEKIVNFLLYMLCVIFLGLDAFSFWLYHHYKKDSTPKE